MSDCIFCKIASGAIAVSPVYEDDDFIAFPDIQPQAPVHILVIPRRHYNSLVEVEDAGVLGQALQAVQKTALALHLHSEGFRTVINTGDNGGQTVHHLHFHVLGGRFMTWPPG